MQNTLSAIVSTSRNRAARPALYLGLSGDAPGTQPACISLANIDQVVICRGERSVLRGSSNGAMLLTLTLDDSRLSRQHARLTRIGGVWAIHDLESKNGTWVGRERIHQRQLVDGDTIVVGHSALVYRDCGGEEGDRWGLDAPDPGLRTLSVAVAARFGDLAAGARSLVPIELAGDSGTGKELAARAVHAISGRPGRFVAVNCGSLPGSLLEAELFGHKKGAYTGATDDRVGFVRSADGGTLFLDEVAELPPASQAALLRVLQEREVVPLGGDRPVKVDLRIVTATLKDLDEEVAARRFREDLRARLLGVKVSLPPLRERREDLGWLIATLLAREVTFSVDTVIALYTYDWPLNIRELERALTAATALARDRIELHHLPETIREALAAAPVQPVELSDEDRQVRELLVVAMARQHGNISAVARELGKDRKQIQRWVKRFGLTRP